MIYAALLLAVALTLPFLTGQIPEIGKMLCPMHLPVLLAGFLCGWKWGFAVGAAAPFLRMFLFGMPQMPSALSMTFELAAYGLLAGLFYALLPKKTGFLYVDLLAAMLGGRAVACLAKFLIAGFGGTEFSFAVFFAGTFTNALPGIALQIVAVPPIVLLCEKIKKKRGNAL